MITHEFSYSFYYFDDKIPFINIILTPHSKKCTTFSDGISHFAYRKDKTIFDKAIENIKKVINGEINEYEYGEEWCVFEFNKEECEVTTLNNTICIVSTKKVYEMLLEWRVYFREHFEDWMNDLYCF